MATLVGPFGHARADVDLEHASLGEGAVALTAFPQAHFRAVGKVGHTRVSVVFAVEGVVFYFESRKTLAEPVCEQNSFRRRNDVVLKS